jgi:DNA polymerase I-like protein with 3'-5' exonuclease and polymerase domains
MDMHLGPFPCSFTPWRPRDGRVFDHFAYDTETTEIDDERPYLTPSYVLGAACDGRRGVFIPREHVRPFFEFHHGVPFVCHNAAFDLRVTDALLRPSTDIYQAVDDRLVWDTLILQRLYTLATTGHTARGEASLAHCARAYLGVELDKAQETAAGDRVRTSFGQFLGKPPSAIPVAYLRYLAGDVIATWHVFAHLRGRVDDVLRTAPAVLGYVDDAWLADVVGRFGPLTHHVQLKASIVIDALRANGIGIDPDRSRHKAGKVQDLRDACRERLRRRGYLAGEPGSDKAMQSLLAQFRRQHPDVELKTTATGKWSTAEEDLAGLAARDPFFADYATYKAAAKLLATYLRKMGKPRLHPRFGYLLESGRTYCGGGFNLQNLPREKGETSAADTIRGCFVAGPGRVFIDSDFSQIELVVLGYVLQHQLGLHSVLAELVNSGRDVHRLIAGTLLEKPADEVTKDERGSVKPVSFGRPGGMGVEGLRKVAKGGYGIDLSTEEVQRRIDAYHQLCPELDDFLRDEIDTGEVLAQALHLTPAEYGRATGKYWDEQDPENRRPQGWLGGMLLKVLRDPQPVTQSGQGRPYSAEEIAFFWERAQNLPLRLKPDMAALLQGRRADRRLWDAVRNWAGRRPVLTVTGRLRAQTTFGGSRNTLFQGPAADGAILALWRVWRAGYRLVDFVHDQLVVESPADDQVRARVAHVEALMKAGMAEVILGMRVQVETVVAWSLNKQDLDPRYAEPSAPKEVRHDALASVA